MSFKEMLHAELRTYRSKLLREGTTGIGFDCLLNTHVVGWAGRQPDAPVGTNALWRLAEYVREILAEDAKLRNWVYEGD